MDVPDDVYEQLCDIYDNHRGEISDEDTLNANAMDWLADNVQEDDAISWEYKINKFNEENDNESESD